VQHSANVLRRDEMQAVGELAGEALGGAGAIVRDVQRGVSGRVFGLLGQPAAPVRVAHDGIAGLVHASVRLGLRAVPSGSGRALALTAEPEAARLADSPRGAFALGAVNGMWGDRIERDHAPLALGLELRLDGEPSDKLAVFVHGLCETDAAWRLGGGPTYGERLRERLGHTPVYARYNTGRHISDNGRALAAALEALVAEHPVRELVLVGHSMGGLVTRSACHYGEQEGHAWTGALRHVVCLGSPHMGAPLERAAARGAHWLSRLPETAPLARLLTVRSAGVKDLRYGACLEEDWQDVDPDEWGPDRCADFPFLPTATYYYVGATVARDKESVLARLIGDVLVQFPSASGDGPLRKLAFEIDHGVHVGGANHLQLLNHPRVYAQLERWLTGSRAAGGPAAVPAPAAR
jgi:pimeloyl-ACP methyl ester carboxylesterase